MKKFVFVLAALAMSATMASAQAFGRDWNSSSRASASGAADGLVRAGRGGVTTSGTSGALARTDTSPPYAAGAAFDEREIAMGSQGRNGANGDFVMGSDAAASANLNGNGPDRNATATAAGSGAYDATAVGANRYTGGLAVGRSGTQAAVLDRPGRNLDNAAAEADQTAAAGATSNASDSTRAVATSAVEAVATAAVTTN